MITICRAETEAHFQDAHELMAEFMAWDSAQTEKAGLDPNEFLDFYYRSGDSKFPGVYAPPEGCLLLATHLQDAAGCIAFQRMTPDICEIKRMYVREKFRGMRIGVNLMQELISKARAAGYGTMRLETTTFMQAAIAVYSSLGFKTRTPYYTIPQNFSGVTVFMELDLGA